MSAQKEILGATKKIREWTNLPITIEWAGEPPRPRLYMERSDGGVDELTNRLTNHQMIEWLEGFSKGFAFGVEAGLVIAAAFTINRCGKNL